MPANRKRPEHSGNPRKNRVKNSGQNNCKQEQGGNPSAPSLANINSPAIKIPLINTVPSRLIYQRSIKTTTDIALAFIDLGYACPEAAEYASNPAQFVSGVFKKWVADKCRDMKLLAPEFVLTDTMATFNEQAEAEPALYIGIRYHNEEAPYRYLEDKICDLEKVYPGLGQTALRKLYTWLCRVSLAITPDFVFDRVQHDYWGGWDTDTEFLENEEEGYTLEDLPVTLEQFEKDFPKYVYRPSDVIPDDELQQISFDKNKSIRELATFLLSEPDEKLWWDYRPSYANETGSEYEHITYSTVLHWSKDGSNITNRVCDDWYEYAHEVGITDLCAVYKCPTEQNGILEMFTNFGKYIEALSWVDKALELLSSDAPDAS